MPGLLRTQIGQLARYASFALASSLPFLVPFTPSRNIELQGYVLIVAGCFAWLSLTIKGRRPLVLNNLLAKICLVLFTLSGLLSTITTPHLGYNIWGAPYIYLGIAGFFSCIGIGLLVSLAIKSKHYAKLYVYIIFLAAISVAYSLLKFHSLNRFGGVFSQADIMACILGCGIMCGLGLLRNKHHRRIVLIGLLFLSTLLVATQTRAVLLIVILLTVFWLYQASGLRPASIAVVSLLTSVGLLCASGALPARLTDKSYAYDSISYRLDLQHQSIKAVTDKPLTGYGPGNIADALDCSQISSSQLLVSCDDGYFFNSSHNIFLDRILGFGVIGGMAYVGLVLVSLTYSYRKRQPFEVIDYILLLIALYYLSNVTSVVVELLFWIALLGVFRQRKEISHV